MNNAVALIRTDGNAEIGYGHAMRMMALASFISDDFLVCFLVKNATAWIKNEISSKYDLIEMPELLSYNDEAAYIADNLPKGSLIFILDGYNFDTAYQKSIREKVRVKTIAIDDFQPFAYVTDAVINHAGMLNEAQFSLESYTKLYNGSQYAMLRNEFNIAASETIRRIDKVQTAFVCMGGTDPDIYTSIVEKLYLFGFSRIIIVVANTDKFENLSAQFKQVELHCNLAANEMIELMKQSDLAVLPPSTLSYEYCSVGGGLYLIQTAENQKFIYNFLTQSGCAKEFKDFHLPTVEILQKQIDQQKNYFNGNNRRLLSKIVFQTAYESLYRVRKAEENDLLSFFHWANDPETRQNSFNNEPITLETHTKWFLNKINAENAVLYVLLANNLHLGGIRFDFTENNALLSYSIDKKYRGKGLGSVILQLGIEAIKANYMHVEQINGYVHQINTVSLASFAKVGFTINNDPPTFYNDYHYYSLYIKR